MIVLGIVCVVVFACLFVWRGILSSAVDAEEREAVQVENTLNFDRRLTEIESAVASGAMSQSQGDIMIAELERMYVADMESVQAAGISSGAGNNRLKVLAVMAFTVLAAIGCYAYLGAYSETVEFETQLRLVEPSVDKFLSGQPLSPEQVNNTPLDVFIAALQVRAQKEPGNASLWMRLGELMMSVPLLDPASIAFQRALDADPTDINAAMYVLQVDLQRNRGAATAVSRRAVAQLQRAGVEPLKVQMLSGLVAYRSNDLETARRIWEDLRDQMPANQRQAVDQSLALLEQAEQAQAQSQDSSLVAQSQSQPSSQPSSQPHAESGPRIFVTLAINGSIPPKPGARLFIAVKRPGQPMPLAVRAFDRLDVSMPIEINDGNLLGPGTSLDSSESLIVDALWSMKGVAKREPGDWVSQPVTVSWAGRKQLNVALTLEPL